MDAEEQKKKNERKTRVALGWYICAVIKFYGNSPKTLGNDVRKYLLDKYTTPTKPMSLRALQKDKVSQKTWVCIGNMFLKFPKEKAKKLLDKGKRHYYIGND
ncbi:hypothetical protein FSP39_002987 [Pinctada imbricata]|uniref:Uncharacterized protein n=1 Tax=Pinctada imbricata TaxID=66713 RepID=A0AA88Y4J9_PINIB|nr:hypothetical protein FSP39_002987 [Pinctada imbricata]